MENKIKAYLENAFEGIPQSPKVKELKAELYVNLVEKYQDEVQGGISPEEAYRNVITGLGDVSELVESVRDVPTFTEQSYEQRRISALLVASAVAIYIISPFVAGLFTVLFSQPIIGGALMFLLIAIATGMLVYNYMMKPKYAKEEETIVEEFKEWRSNNENKKLAYKALASGYWGLVVAIYLMVSFMFGGWSYTWLIFILAVAVANIAKAVIYIKDSRN